MSEIDKMKAEMIKLRITGIIAKEMGYAQGSKVVNSAEMVFKALGQMTYRDFRRVKKYLNDSTTEGN